MNRYKVIINVIRRSGTVSMYAGTVKAKSEEDLHNRLRILCATRWPGETCSALVDPKWGSLQKVLDKENKL